MTHLAGRAETVRNNIGKILFLTGIALLLIGILSLSDVSSASFWMSIVGVLFGMNLTSIGFLIDLDFYSTDTLIGKLGSILTTLSFSFFAGTFLSIMYKEVTGCTWSPVIFKSQIVGWVLEAITNKPYTWLFMPLLIIGTCLIVTGGVFGVYSEFSGETGLQSLIQTLKRSRKSVRKSPLSMIGIALIMFYCALAVLAPLIAPPIDYKTGQVMTDWTWFYIPRDASISPSHIPSPPSARHPLGTIQDQYDLWYGIVWGTVNAFRIGLSVAFASLAIGVAVGTIGGYFGGIADLILTSLVDIMLAFPGIILAMAFFVILIPLGFLHMDAVLLALIITGWASYARLMRGEILKVKSEDYVEAAKAAGCSEFRIICRHVLPNSIQSAAVLATMNVGTTVLLATTLTFIGIGTQIYIPAHFADWGQIMSSSRTWIIVGSTNPFSYWWVTLVPGLTIFGFVLGWSLLGDAFQDILDPILKKR